MKKVTSASFGLFNYRSIYFWRNLKDIPIFFSRLKHVIHYGYYPQAQWESFEYFIQMWEEILSGYRTRRHGDPVIIKSYKSTPEWEKKNAEAFDKILDTMLADLEVMKTDPPFDMERYKEVNDRREVAKKEFFKLFSEHFYDWWD